jgi:mRNA interferase MazF
MAMVIEQFGVYLVTLDPTIGAEIRKTRPCIVISPDELNQNHLTVIIAPLITVVRKFPFRVDCTVAHRRGQIALDQLRAVDKQRLVKRFGRLDPATSSKVRSILLEMFG